jgi:putative nucleotide binding protein
MSEVDSDETDVRRAVVLDYLAHGLSDDGRPQYAKSPAGYALDVEDFELFQIAFDDEARLTIGTEIVIEPASERDVVEDCHWVEYEDLSSGAQSELEYVVQDLVEENEQRFVDFYNDAQPITLRLHQLNLLPGIGKKLRNGILDERKRKPFESFDELSERVSGLHDPADILAERILEELRDDDLKYRTFVGRQDEQQ